MSKLNGVLRPTDVSITSANFKMFDINKKIKAVITSNCKSLLD